MKKEILFRRSTLEDVAYLAKHIRREDRREVEALGATPYDAFKFGLEPTADTWTALLNGVPMAMLGTYKESLLGDSAEIWMLGTRDVDLIAREMIVVTRRVLDYELTRHKELYNYVDARFTKAIKWLKILGFTMGEPFARGINGEKFIKITLRRK
jgi:hypothetical protein